MSSPDFRAELQLLFDAAESFVEPALGHHRPWTAALDRARAALAAPQQGVPSDELRTIAPSSELVWEWYEENDKFFENVSEARQYVANKAARWGAEQARAVLTRHAAAGGA